MLRNHESVEPTVLLPSPADVVEGVVEKEGLATVSDADLKELSDWVEAAKARNARRTGMFFKATLATSLVSFVGSLTWTVMLIKAMHSDVSPSFPAPFILPLILLSPPAALLFSGVVMLWRGLNNAQMLAAAERLRQIEDVRVVGPLLDTAVLPDTTRRPEFWRALERLLPQMTQEEILSLGEERLAILAFWVQCWDVPANRRLFGNATDMFLPKLLGVIAQVGRNSFALKTPVLTNKVQLMPTLKKWVGGQGSGKDPAVQQAAVACLAAIEQQMALGRAGEQLLRASAPTAVGAESLLRPLEGGVQTDPKELLRPGESE